MAERREGVGRGFKPRPLAGSLRPRCLAEEAIEAEDGVTAGIVEWRGQLEHALQRENHKGGSETRAPVEDVQQRTP